MTIISYLTDTECKNNPKTNYLFEANIFKLFRTLAFLSCSAQATEIASLQQQVMASENTTNALKEENKGASLAKKRKTTKKKKKRKITTFTSTVLF